MNRLHTRLGALAACAAFALSAAAAVSLPASAAGTSAGTQINNTASATYTDGSGNNYTTTSNTVVSYVQNAPSLTIVNNGSTVGTPSTVTPGTTATDIFTVTNTGNAPAYFAFDLGAGNNGTNDASDATALTYAIFNGATQVATGLTLAQLNNYFLHSDPTAGVGSPYTVAAGSSLIIKEIYTVNAAAADAATPQQKLTGGSVQPAVGANAAQAATTTTIATATDYDQVHTDATLTVAKSAVVGGTTAAPTVTYTVNAWNPGKQNAVPVHKEILAPLGAGVFTADGYLITDALPKTGAPNNVQTTLSGTPAAPTVPAGCTGQTVYTTVANGLSGWTTVNPGVSTTFVGVYVKGCNLSANGTNASNNISFTFTVTGSTATGDANSSALKNTANGVIGTQAGTLYAPFTDGSTPANTVGDTTALTAANTPVGQTTIAGHGEGDTTSAASPKSYGVLVGPYTGAGSHSGADSTGAFDGSTPDQLKDFAAAIVPIGGTGSGASPFSSALTATGYAYTGSLAAPTTESFSGATAATPASVQTVCIREAIYNNSNADDTYTLGQVQNASPTAWPSGGSAVGVSFNGSGATCTSGTLGITTIAVSAGQTKDFWVQYSFPASTTLTTLSQYDDTVTATSQGNAGTTNTTHDDLYPGGFVAVGKAASYTTDGCSTAAVGATNPVPGGCIVYSLVFKNLAPSATSGGSTGNVSLTAKGLTLLDDGYNQANGWYAGGTDVASTPTVGITVAPSDCAVNGVTLSGANASTITYYAYVFGSGYAAGNTSFTAPSPASGATTGQTSSGPAKVQVLVGGASTYAINAGDRGVFSFKVQVRAF